MSATGSLPIRPGEADEDGYLFVLPLGISVVSAANHILGRELEKPAATEAQRLRPARSEGEAGRPVGRIGVSSPSPKHPSGMRDLQSLADSPASRWRNIASKARAAKVWEDNDERSRNG
jgi:hypothetical protein